MKKNMRLILLAMLVIVMVVMTAVVVSADDPAPADPVTVTVANEVDLTVALAGTADIVELTADIDVAAQLTIARDVTLKGNFTITFTAPNTGILATAGTVTFDGVNVSGTTSDASGFLVKATGGKLVVKGGVFDMTAGNGSVVSVDLPATAEISGGKFYVREYGTGGVVLLVAGTPADPAAAPVLALTITSGEFYNGGTGSGSFPGTRGTAYSLKINVKCAVKISGGIFSYVEGVDYDNPDSYAEQVKNAGQAQYGGDICGIAVGVTAQYVDLEISGGCFFGGDSAAAVDAAANTTITVKGDKAKFFGYRCFRYGANSTVVLEGGYFGRNPGQPNMGGVVVTNGANVSVTIKDGTFNGSVGAGAIVNANNSGTYRIEGGDFVVSNTDCLIATSGGVNMVITGGNYVQNGSGYLFNANNTGTYRIEGGNFSANNAAPIVRISDGGATVTITGGNYVQEGNGTVIDKNNGTLVIEGGSFSIEGTGKVLNFVTGKTLKATITGGKFAVLGESGYGIYVEDGSHGETLTINGALFIDGGFATELLYAGVENQPSVNVVTAMYLSRTGNKRYANFITDLTFDKSSYSTYKYEGSKYIFSLYMPSNDVLAPKSESVEIRPSYENAGISYISTVDAETVAALKQLGTVSYGTVIVPMNILLDAGVTTMEGLKAYAEANEKLLNEVYVDIVANNGLTENADGSVSFRASLINIKEANLGRVFVAIPYAKVVEVVDEVAGDPAPAEPTVTYYYGAVNSCRGGIDISTLADQTLDDVKTKQGEVYKYPSVSGSGYSPYNEYLQNAFKAYLLKEGQTSWFVQSFGTEE